VAYLLQDRVRNGPQTSDALQGRMQTHYKDCHVTKYRNEMRNALVRCSGLAGKKSSAWKIGLRRALPQGRGMRGAPLCPEGMPQGLPLTRCACRSMNSTATCNAARCRSRFASSTAAKCAGRFAVR